MDNGNVRGYCTLGVLATVEGLAKTCLQKWHFSDFQICLRYLYAKELWSADMLLY